LPPSLTASPLEGLDKDTWYVFERVALAKDLYTGGQRTFTSPEDAQEFRGLIYRQYGEHPGGEGREGRGTLEERGGRRGRGGSRMHA
jgi:hypothetical protein